MLHADELAYCIAKKYPNLVRGKDYWVAHEVDRQTRIQIDTALIVKWLPSDPPKPTTSELQDLWDTYGAEAIEWHLANHLRGMRDFELSKVDPQIAVAEDEGDAERVKALRAYRQALRNVPQQSGFPFTVKWPVPPT
ncbi:XkdW family protein [Burkholderia cenocepacia]|uniref:XkdW family protein n=1 Tax=Burkholderia cenocepacia TaxID=95486 RepID=UPI002938E13F|nr:phage tail assembly chaperone [Burkholderia cenocepacia]MDV3100727.1 phage tail assembly chaperone [Burkholderia cenocepacia]